MLTRLMLGLPVLGLTLLRFSPSPQSANHAGATAITPYSPPAASAQLLGSMNFDSAQPLDPKFHARFTDCDQKDLCDGTTPKYKCSTDPSRNTVFLKVIDGTIFYDAKMAIDADGSEMAKTNPGMTDQADTSFRYPLAGSPSLDADKVPYIVVPSSDFEKPLGIELGDIAAVVYGTHVAFAIVGDHGPKCKLGEGSIQLHELLGHTGCKKRDSNKVCTVAGTSSIDSDVLYFIFPGSKPKIIDGLTPENINDRLTTEGHKLFDSLTNGSNTIVPPNNLGAVVN